MKKFIILLILSLTSVVLYAQRNTAEWKEVQSIEIPKDTPIYYSYTDSGNIKYYIRIEDVAVTVSKSNAEKFLAKQVRLELVKWYSSVNKKYKYTVRKLDEAHRNIDLETVFNKNYGKDQINYHRKND